MNTMSYSEVRKHLANTMDRVFDEHEPIIITRRSSGKHVVMVSLDDYNSKTETEYLLQSPANKKNLMDSIKEYEKGNFTPMALIDY